LQVRVGGPDRASLGTFRQAVIEVHFRPGRDLADAGAHIMFEDLNGFGILGLDSKDFVERVKVSEVSKFKEMNQWQRMSYVE